MPTKIIAGLNAATRNRREIRFSPFHGDETLWEIEGPKDTVLPLVQELRNAGYAGTYSEDKSPIARCQYHVPLVDDPGSGSPPPEVPVPVWEMFSNAVEIDILEANGIYDAMTDEDRRKIREAINNPQEGRSPAVTGTALEIYLLMLKGVRSVRVNQVTLRLSRSVSSSFAVWNAILNNNYVYTSATLRSVESVPVNIFLPTSSSDGEFAYGWLKKFPGIQTTGFNKIQLTQEWEFGKWPLQVYGNPL